MENPFSLKVGQVFTGFGVGCGIGIGVGRPIYFGAIPALLPVLSATRGATDALSGIGRHLNSSLIKLGMKRIEAGVGCGIGIGHGFGAGIALKPWVIQRLQSSIAEAITKIMMNVGLASKTSSFKSFSPGSVQSDAFTNNLQFGTPLDLASNIMKRKHQPSGSVGRIHDEVTNNTFPHKDNVSGTIRESHTEEVINNFLKSPALKDEVEVGLDEVARSLRTENNVLQLLLKHQEIIEKLVNENEKLHNILIEDLKVPPSKLQASGGLKASFDYPCSDCFNCRRRRKLRR
ncbi:DNA polymerase epsilon subunit 1 [Apostasia shenzhenica]|uniref:DNA polymerase epsilon subunit 1 n=1 Tax=Apostasia shenzhenica TaxID=1088818 RepID=A0A2I0ACR0_9ASPA|nr:DNA polymerase epsilon subunit 1 [Apostasia shenzhenica]